MGFIGAFLFFSQISYANDCAAAKDALSLFKNACGAQCSDLPLYKQNVRKYCGVRKTLTKKVKKRKPASKAKKKKVRRIVKKRDQEKNKEIQFLLSQLKYDVGIVDGDFGPKTCNAISSFSKDVGSSFICIASVKLRESLVDELLKKRSGKKENEKKKKFCEQFNGFSQAKLVSLWYNRAQKKSVAFRDGQGLFASLIDNLQNDLFWVGEWRENSALALNLLNTVSNAFVGALGLGSTAKQLDRQAQRIYEAMSSGQDLSTILSMNSDELLKGFAEDLVCKATVIGCAGILAKNTVEDAIATAQIPGDFRETRKVIVGTLKPIENSLRDIEAKISTYDGYKKLLEEYVVAQQEACGKTVSPNPG